jgi:rsbT co-antagonist protein RsbR
MHDSTAPTNGAAPAVDVRIAALEAELELLRQQHTHTSDQLQRFVALLDNSTEFIGIATVDGQPLFINRAGRELVGLEADADLDQMNLTQFFFPDDLATVQATVLPAVQEHSRWTGPFAFRHFQTGAAIPVLYNLFSVRDPQSGEVLGLGTVTRDMTAEHAAEETRQNFVAVIENSSDFIGIATPDGRALYVNEAGRRLVGLADEEAARATAITEYFMPEDLPFIQETILPQIMETGRWEGAFRFRHFQTQEAIPVYYTLFLVRDRTTGAPIAISTVSRDIREQLRREQEREALAEQIIAAQQASLRELSTPLIPLADHVIAMPLIGSIDSARAQQLIEALLHGVMAHQASTAILDITGVPVVDTQVANAIVRAAQAVKLLGAEIVLTGIRPEVAQTLVGLGTTLEGVRTHSTFQRAVAEALRAGLSLDKYHS